MRLFLGGEGPTELGRWFKESPYTADIPTRRKIAPEVGVIEALLDQVSPPGEKARHEVVGASQWKRIRKFRAQDPRQPEARNVLGLALQADEAGSDALIFVRDQDGDEERQADVEAGLSQAQAKFPRLKIVGGVAVQEIESWILAILGERRSERHTDAKQYLEQHHRLDSREHFVTTIEQRGLSAIPEDATSLHTWLERARTALHPTP